MAEEERTEKTEGTEGGGKEGGSKKTSKKKEWMIVGIAAAGVGVIWYFFLRPKTSSSSSSIPSGTVTPTVTGTGYAGQSSYPSGSSTPKIIFLSPTSTSSTAPTSTSSTTPTSTGSTIPTSTSSTTPTGTSNQTGSQNQQSGSQQGANTQPQQSSHVTNYKAIPGKYGLSQLVGGTNVAVSKTTVAAPSQWQTSVLGNITAQNVEQIGQYMLQHNLPVNYTGYVYPNGNAYEVINGKFGGNQILHSITRPQNS